MRELIVQLFSYVRGSWRFRWWILGIAWVVSVVGWVIVAKMPDQYQASARVYVDTQSLLKPLLRGLAVEGNERQRLLLMTRTLLSRPNMEKVMRMADLDLQAKTEEETDRIIKGLQQHISLGTTRDVNLYTLSYSHDKPELAKLVVKSLLTIFVESGLGDKRKEQDSARQFLEQQVADYERRLVEAEDRQKRFKQKNLSFMPGEGGGGYYQKLQENHALLSQAELELQIEKDRLQAVELQMQDAEDEPGYYGDELFVETPTNTVYDARIANLEANLDDLLLRYTEKHPDIINTRRTLQQLRTKQRQEVEAALVDEQEGLGLDGPSSPIYQQLRLTYADAKANVAAKETIVAEYKKRIENLQAAVDRVLQVESEEQQLNRDYNILSNQHNQLMKRLESARLSHDVDISSKTARFRIVEPPRVPPTPSGPPRMLLSSGVLLGGLLIGAVLAFFMSQIRPTFDNRQTLNEISDLPVLGSIGMVWTQAQLRQRQRRHVAFLMGLLGLVSVYSLVMAVYLFQVDWIGYIGEVRRMAGI